MMTPVEACADALLSAAALAMWPETDIHAAVDLANRTLLRVVVKTLREGGKD